MDKAKLEAVRAASNMWLNAMIPRAGADLSRKPQLTITPSSTVTTMEAAVSPDCSYELVKATIDAAQHDICLYIYNASADHLLGLLQAAKERGVRVRLMFDVTDARGGERQKLEALGVDLKEAPSTGDRRVFTVCHQKFAVIDDAVLLLGSANWAGTSIPLVTSPGQYKKGNREWIVQIADQPLAAWFKALFVADWEIPALERGLPPGPVLVARAGLPLAAVARKRPPTLFAQEDVVLQEPATVTPLISPDNYYDAVLELIGRAEQSVDIEQQYILAGGPKTEGLLAALEEKHRQGKEIRVIVSPAFRQVGELDNWELSMDSLDAFGLKDCLRAMNLDYYTHLHNKGLIIDRRVAVVSSTNWSENSIARAREAGVAIDAPAIAGYFARVFDFDWQVAWGLEDAQVNTPRLLAPAPGQAGGASHVHPADLV